MTTVSCLGRSMELSMLYDIRNDALINDINLLDPNAIDNFTIVKNESIKYDIVLNDTLEKKVQMMKIEKDVKLSYMAGLIDLDGSAKYLDHYRMSDNQARIVLHWNYKGYYKQSMLEKYPEISDQNTATHIITAIKYGADAFFVFNRELTDQENRIEIEENFKESLSKIIAGTVSLTEDEGNEMKKFGCKFFGDMPLEEDPKSIQEAIEIYKKLPDLVRSLKNDTVYKTVYGIPKKVHLWPLTNSDKDSMKSISDNIVSEIQSQYENNQRISAIMIDLENSNIVQKFIGIKSQIDKFTYFLNQFRTLLQKRRSDLIPEIRQGKSDEQELLEFLENIKKSAYDTRKLSMWLNHKKKEIDYLREYLKFLDLFPIIYQLNQLEQFTKEPNFKHVICFSMGSLITGEHPFLDFMEFSSDDDFDIDVDTLEAAEESWCENDAITAYFQNQFRLFQDFVQVNNFKTDLKFLVLALPLKKGKHESPGTIFIYAQGRRQLFQPPSAPGQPKMISVAENEITIEWKAPEIGTKSVINYTIIYQPIGSDSWSRIDTGGTDTTFRLTRLEPETDYSIKISAVCESGKSQFSDESQPIKTKSMPPLALWILPLCEKIVTGENGQPSWYQIPVYERYLDKNQCLKRIDVGDVYPNSRGRPVKVVLLVGATGSGKSTLINGTVNYLFGVKKEDDFRLQLIPKESDQSQAHSQTTHITQYFFHWQPQSCIPYNLVFIDTPGYADTRGIQQDAQLNRQLKTFFHTAVDHIDAVGFVIQSALPRLTETQKYIFDGILSLFGKDIEENIFLMLTFTDGSTPPVLSAIEEFGIVYNEYFKFNNSVFTLNSSVGEQNAANKAIDSLFWELAITAYKDFFNKLGQMNSKSLRLTREVLTERRRLEKTVDILSVKVNDGVNQLITMREELPFIIEYEAEMDSNRQYTKTIDVPKTRKVTFNDGHFVTNCMRCSHTCHDPCGIPNDADKAGCWAMEPSGNCRVCKNRCHWNQHYNRNYIYQDYIAKETITMDDMKKKISRS